MNSFLLLYKKCMKSGSNIVFVLLRFLFYFVFYRKRLFVHQRVSLKGVRVANFLLRYICIPEIRDAAFLWPDSSKYLYAFILECI